MFIHIVFFVHWSFKNNIMVFQTTFIIIIYSNYIIPAEKCKIVFTNFFKIFSKTAIYKFHELLNYQFHEFFSIFYFIGRANSTTEGGNAGLSGSVAATQTIMSNNDNQMAAFGPVTPEQEAAKSQVCVTY